MDKLYVINLKDNPIKNYTHRSRYKAFIMNNEVH